MNKFRLLLPFLFLLVLIGAQSKSYAQSQPVLYFCERYDSDDGEVGISDRFTTGYLTVMVKSSTVLGLTNCHIQFDRFNASSGKFEFYKKFDYKIESDMKYVFFNKNDDSDLSFDKPGFYRVFLLDKSDKTVASALVQIIPKD
jgi:hypothetical protein